RARAAATVAAVPSTPHSAATADRLSAFARGSSLTTPERRLQPAGIEVRPVPLSNSDLTYPRRVPGPNASSEEARAGERLSNALVWLGLPALLISVAAIVALRRRARASGAPDRAPIIASNVALLPDNPDLLRELDPAHRARIHDDRRGYPGATSPAARRRDVLPDRHGRECFQERARRRSGRRRSEDLRRPARRRPLAAAARPGRSVSRLLHTHDR